MNHFHEPLATVIKPRDLFATNGHAAIALGHDFVFLPDMYTSHWDAELERLTTERCVVTIRERYRSRKRDLTAGGRRIAGDCFF